ncbi:gephyrin [Microdochium bolleyi]|uniref:Gephyrin n=1 Tax=Microdochium bolleyi TaxID=196109 RepID=A0A136ILJ8_9PEZI|nr:gephyrin [Microdochium bolleyi]
MSDLGALRVALLIVSDTAAKDPSTDASGAALGQVLETEGQGKWELAETKIVPDNVTLIQRQLMMWADNADQSFNLILTTGGTGFAVSDNTPEAAAAMLHRPAPGLVHAMLSASLSVTPFAMMSRPVAGVRNKSVIVTLPGSPKGAKENLQAIIKTLPHACVQAAGANSRAIHAGGVKKLEADAGLVRHTNPGSNPMSNDPSLGPSRRNRESPYPMLSVADALAKIREHIPALEITMVKVDKNLPGHVLAQDVSARENVPAFRASIVDGYAVVVPKDGNMKGVFPVVSISHAAATAGSDGSEAQPLKEGEIARITTGAPLPPGATSVIMVEDTVLKTMTDDGKEEKEVELLADDVKEGENIREVGSDIESGSVILSKGEQISAQGGEIGLLAAVGVAEVHAYRKPVVGVLSTGDEIVEHDRPEALRHGEVRDTNRITLISAAQEAGYPVVDLGIAGDKPGTLEETLRDALRRCDLVITTGGVSMGELDLLKPTIERSLGGTIHFGRVAMKPGKPTTFATVPVKQTTTSTSGSPSETARRVDKAVFSLPGNPASAIVTFHLFVLPALHQMAGVSPPGLPRLPVVLAHDFPLDKARVEYHRAVVSVGKDGVIRATSTGGQRSSRVGSLKGANALLCLPQGAGPLRKGATVEALLMGGIRSDL